MKSAIIENGIVINVILGKLPNSVPCEDQVCIGWSCDGVSFVAPISEPVSPTQAEQEALRHVAYTAEADPLFFKWQAGEATKEEWEATRQEIRDRFPYPEKATL